jgi:hypothetical protein
MKRHQFGHAAGRKDSESVTAGLREDLVSNYGLPIPAKDFNRRPIDKDMELHETISGR